MNCSPAVDVCYEKVPDSINFVLNVCMLYYGFKNYTLVTHI